MPTREEGYGWEKLYAEREVLGWEPKTSLLQGLTETYTWIHSQVRSSVGVPS